MTLGQRSFALAFATFSGLDTISDRSGRCRIRTCVGVSRRIYSPLPLAARATCLGARPSPGIGDPGLVRLAGYNEDVPKTKTAEFVRATADRCHHRYRGDGSNGGFIIRRRE